MDDQDIEFYLQELVNEGQLRVTGTNEQGETTYQVTQEGKLRIAALLDETLEEAVTNFATKMQLPEFAARDLLIQHVIQMVIADE